VASPELRGFLRTGEMGRIGVKSLLFVHGNTSARRESSPVL
jgi:hypothetical protein